MFSVPSSSDDGSSSQTINVQTEPEKPWPRRTTSAMSTLRKRANALRDENARLKHEIQVMQTKSQDSIHPKILSDYEKLLDDDHKILNKEFNVLRKESILIFLSGQGDLEIANRTQAYLDKVTKMFHCQLSLINSMDSTQEHKMLLLEHLKKLFVRNVCQMDEWISLVIEAKYSISELEFLSRSDKNVLLPSGKYVNAAQEMNDLLLNYYNVRVLFD